MKPKRFNLQLFAEGGDAGDTGNAGEPAEVVDVNEETDKQIEKATKWKELIDGEYRDEYKKSVSEHLDRRFKETKELKDRLKEKERLSAFLSQRYEVDPEDSDAILQAMQNDDALFAEQAAERGLSTEQYKEVRRLEFENAELQREHDRAQADAAAQEIYADWVRQSDQLKTQFPDFDLQTELDNQDFVSMLQNGISVEHAFKVLHMDDIMGGLAEYTAKNIASKVTEGIRTKGMRPTENGIGHSSRPIKEQIDANNLTLDDIKKITERVQNGERIFL